MGEHPDDPISEGLCLLDSRDVPNKLPATRTVLIPVVLDQNVSLGIGQIEATEKCAVTLTNRDLELGLGQSCSDKSETEQRLHTGFCPVSDEPGRKSGASNPGLLRYR